MRASAIRCVVPIVCLGVLVGGAHASPSPTDSAAANGGADAARARVADLVIGVADPASAVTFRNQEFAEESCELYEGCVGGSGKRSLIEIRATVRNAGAGALDLGQPWDSEYFAQSLCHRTYTLYNFIAADLLDATGAIVASASLSTNCVADPTGGYTCSAQGLSANAESQQPTSQCDFLDATGLPAGDYTLRLTVNPDGAIQEGRLSNNTVEIPVDYPACAGTMCGGACCPEGIACADGVCMLPDLRVNAESAAESLWISTQTFGEDSCELEEMCVSGSGRRRLLNFEGRIENWGPGDLAPGEEHDNPLFEYSACHGHYHFVDFTDYKLLDAAGGVVAQGHKQSFCLISMVELETPSVPAPPGTRPEPEPLEGGEHGGCNFLRAGWADIYGVGTPCQWVDITDVPEGDYVLQLSVNPLGRVAESVTDNNTVQIPVHLSPDVPCEPQPEICGDATDQDCDEQPDTWDDDCWQACYPGDPFCEEPEEVTGNSSCDSAYELVDSGAFAGPLNVEAGAAPAACGGEGAGAYFRFSLETEQAVYLGTIGSSLDTVINLYRDACGGAEPVGCADDACGGVNGHIVQVLAPGDYVAVVRAKAADGSGRYRLKYQHAPSSGAIVIEGPGVYAGDTTASDDSGIACSAGLGESGPDDTYVLATCGGQLMVSTCGTSSFASSLSVRSPIADGASEQCDVPGGYLCASDPLGTAINAYAPQSGLTFISVDGVTPGDSGEYQLVIAF
jgi:hypothetical protein